MILFLLWGIICLDLVFCFETRSLNSVQELTTLPRLSLTSRYSCLSLK